ncbi:hypothetical protein QBC37DRAFT_203581 [Rhypophila decipiens]|uniref:Uncharacterized protein n=1 Tax=Rhypophila decipiens TaxID=261697 RepID=A0AAN7B6C7_9PEZI|nr:hypothetical protein QBC37DRAFT_203581 [Rhypophila decipiens]
MLSFFFRRKGTSRCLRCVQQDSCCEGFCGKPCFECGQQAHGECTLVGDPTNGQNRENPEDFPVSSNSTARAAPVDNQSEKESVPQPSSTQQQAEALLRRDLPKNDEEGDERNAEMNRIPERMVDDYKIWIGDRTRPQPPDPELFAFAAQDTVEKDKIFTVAGVRYMKHYLNMFVKHLEEVGVDISKINMDSPLGIPRFDPWYLLQRWEASNLDRAKNKRKDRGGDDAHSGNGGEGPSKRARV